MRHTAPSHGDMWPNSEQGRSQGAGAGGPARSACAPARVWPLHLRGHRSHQRGRQTARKVLCPPALPPGPAPTAAASLIALAPSLGERHVRGAVRRGALRGWLLKLSVAPRRLVRFTACVDAVAFLLSREVSHPRQDTPVVPGSGP